MIITSETLRGFWENLKEQSRKLEEYWKQKKKSEYEYLKKYRKMNKKTYIFFYEFQTI